jgi:hypothetical protein
VIDEIGEALVALRSLFASSSNNRGPFAELNRTSSQNEAHCIVVRGQFQPNFNYHFHTAARNRYEIKAGQPPDPSIRVSRGYR